MGMIEASGCLILPTGRTSSAPTIMSGESITYERRNRSEDFGAELDGDCVDDDKDSMRPRRAFERQRSWKNENDAAVVSVKPGSPSNRAEGEARDKIVAAEAEEEPLGRYGHRCKSRSEKSMSVFRVLEARMLTEVAFNVSCCRNDWNHGPINSFLGRDESVPKGLF